MTEAVFAGAQVGPQGVSPDSGKLTAIVCRKNVKCLIRKIAYKKCDCIIM
jgi:hypothetical protein